MDSDYICNHCAVFFSKQGWVDYCDRNNKDQFFPKVEGKKPFPANWVFFSHMFAPGVHEIVKDRHKWSDYLLDPPEPPFCFVLSTLCKKHLIYRSEISYYSDDFPVQFEEKRVYINRADFKKCLVAFELLYSMGLSKSSIRTGDYNSSSLLKCDKLILEENEIIISEFRRLNSVYVEICEFIGMKHE